LWNKALYMEVSVLTSPAPLQSLIFLQIVYRMRYPIPIERLEPLTTSSDIETCAGSSRGRFTSKSSSFPTDGIGVSSMSSRISGADIPETSTGHMWRSIAIWTLTLSLICTTTRKSTVNLRALAIRLCSLADIVVLEGFNIAVYEWMETIPSLWPTVKGASGYRLPPAISKP